MIIFTQFPFLKCFRRTNLPYILNHTKPVWYTVNSLTYKPSEALPSCTILRRCNQLDRKKCYVRFLDWNSSCKDYFHFKVRQVSSRPKLHLFWVWLFYVKNVCAYVKISLSQFLVELKWWDSPDMAFAVGVAVNNMKEHQSYNIYVKTQSFYLLKNFRRLKIMVWVAILASCHGNDAWSYVTGGRLGFTTNALSKSVHNYLVVIIFDPL